MDTFSLDNVRATVILDTRRPKRNGYFPVKYRVTLIRKQVYYTCMDLTIREWESIDTTKNKELIRAIISE